MLLLLSRGEGVHNRLDIRLGQLIVVRDLDTFLCRVDEQHRVIRFRLLHHHDTGRDGGAEKEIARQLDDTVDIVVLDQVFADLLLRAAAVHDAGEAYDRRRAVRREPRERVHDERHVRLALRREYARGREARIIDQDRVIVADPFDGVRRIADDDLERLVIPVLRADEGVLVGDIELVKADIVQEHIDAAEVVGGEVDLLTVEALTDVVFAEDFGGF